MTSMWSPWRGCKKFSSGCLHCYIHKGDAKRGVDTSNIVKTKQFDLPILKNKNGAYKMKSGLVYVCFSTDFLLEEADEWRIKAWEMIKERSDCHFLFLTKRICRLQECLPPDWNDGYDNVTICCTIEDQESADKRLPIFTSLPIKNRVITAQPLIEEIDISKYLSNIQEVVVGGESDKEARALDYSWVLSLRDQCIKANVNFTFRQLGTHFIKDGNLYTVKTQLLMSQARKANIDVKIGENNVVYTTFS